MEVETRPIYWQTMGIIIGPISQRDCNLIYIGWYLTQTRETKEPRINTTVQASFHSRTEVLTLLSLRSSLRSNTKPKVYGCRLLLPLDQGLALVSAPFLRDLSLSQLRSPSGIIP